MWYCLPAIELNAGFLDNDSAYKPDPGEKTFSPSSPKAGLYFLFRLSEPRFAYSLKITPVSCLAHAPDSFPNPRTSFGARVPSAA
jgi:hypothetical protein